MAEVERRAAAAGLPSLVWPPGWPSDYLMAMRTAVWAGRHGKRDAFIRTALRRAFTQGADLAQPAALRAVADAVDRLDEVAAARG